MKIISKLLLIVLVLTVSQEVFAASCIQTGNSIGLVGLDNTNGDVFAALFDHSNQCGCTHVRFKVINTNTDMALSVLMAAKLANQKVRVDISDSTNCDTGYRVYIH